MASVKANLQEFQAFALHGNALQLAIGVAVGGAFTAVVDAIVSGIFTPLIAAIFGQSNFSSLYFTINGSHFMYGLVVNALITLFVIAFVLFFFVVKPIAALQRRNAKEVAPTDAPCPACLTTIPMAATRCPSCTESLTTGWALSN